jgi:hypothetical protein
VFLFELFEQDDGVVDTMRDYCIDILMPLANQGVPFILVQTLVDKLREQKPGIEIDKALVFHILDPTKTKIITKIEGDKIYFEIPETEDRLVSDDQKQKDDNKISKMASDQARKSVKK